MNSRRIEDLHTYFQPVVAEVMRRAPERGIYPFIMQGKRSLEYQACLYAQGRVAAGKSIKFAGVVSPVTTELRGPKVYVRCGAAENVVSFIDWGKQVTWILWSWHVLGFAVDFGFRSGPDRLDHWIGELERAKEWKKIEGLYASLDAVWAEAVDGYSWGGRWGPRQRDLPHFEWHPGRSVEDVRAGNLPPYPQQCARCQAFRAVLVAASGQAPLCQPCHAAATSESWPLHPRDCARMGGRR